jgi:hypothetical protein
VKRLKKSLSTEKSMTETFRRLAREHRTPLRVQKLLRQLKYNRGDTLYSAATAWRRQSAHCLEGAVLAAAILEHRGYPPLVVSISSWDYLDHVLFVFREKSGWGAIGRSRDEGLHGRQPRFRSLRDLVFSYMDPYVDGSGRITGFALAHLDDCGIDWRFSPRNIWGLERYLNEIAHQKLRSSKNRYERALAHYKKHRCHPKKSYWW